MAIRPPDNLGSLFGNTTDEQAVTTDTTQSKETTKSTIEGEKKKRSDLEVRVAMIGNVDSGKSTLIGVLCGGMLDDGRGGARSSVFTHKHESCSGRTSAISHQLIGFNDEKQIIVGMKHGKLGKSYWNDLIKRTSKHMLLIDLCGHRKYLKTTIFGLTGLRPDYAIVLVGANMGVPRMTREHIGIACALKIPIIVVVTKVDICPPHIFKQTMTKLKRTLRTARKMPFVVNKKPKVARAIELISTSRTTCPVFITSNVNGRGIPELRAFLGGLEKPQKINASARRMAVGTGACNASASPKDSIPLAARPPVFQIDSTFVVPGVGLVLSGTLMQGEVGLNRTLLLGPDKSGTYRKVIVRGIHSNRVALPLVGPGKSASFAIRAISRKDALNRQMIRKGMVLLGDRIPEDCRATRVFEAEVLVLHHQTTCGVGYTPVIHCGVVRQSAAILGVWKKSGKRRLKIKAAVAAALGSDGNDPHKLRTGDRATVRFRFCYYTEYIEVGTTILFREGRAKGIGKIVRLLGSGEDLPDMPTTSLGA